MGLYERFVLPAVIDCACGMSFIKKERNRVVPDATGDVLEVGCGAGPNFALYDPLKVNRVYAVDPNAQMLRRARRHLDSLTTRPDILLMKTGGEALPFADKSVDTVVFTFVLCTIPNWRATLDEARRVLRPDGKILFIEHGLTPDEGIARWQRRLEPIQKIIAGGCHLTRSPRQMFEAAGFHFESLQTGFMEGAPKLSAPASFLYWGTARG